MEGIDAKTQKIIDAFDTRAQEMLDAVKARDEQIDELGGLKTSMETRLQKTEEKLEEVESEYREAKAEWEKAQAEANRPGGSRGEVKTLGDRVLESEEFASFGSKQKFRGDSDAIEFKSFFPTGEAKTLNSTDGGAWGQMGYLIEPDDLGVIAQPQRELTLRDKIPSFPTTSDTVTYMEELGWANVYTELNASALSGATSITVKSVAGLFVGQELQIGTAADPTAIIKTTISAINTTTLVLTVTALGAARSANDPVSAVAIGMTAPGAQKPEANLLGVVERSLPIGTVAHYMTAHRQTMADAPQLRGIINQRLIFGLAQSAEEQILYGTGSPPDMLGILNNPAIVNGGAYDESDYGLAANNGAWRLDHVRRQITKVQNANYSATDLMIYPDDWQEIELSKGTDAHYIWVTVPNGGVERLWRVAVNVTPAIKKGTGMVGNLTQAAYMLDREQANVRFAEQHSDYFTKNMVAILAEERLGLALVRPQAIVKFSFSTQA